MNHLLKTRFITAIALLAAFFAITYISCKKSGSSSGQNCPYCANGSVCLKDTCRCPAGYQGPSCDTISRTKFDSTWQVVEKGSLSNTISEYSINIYNDSAINKVLIMNFFNYFYSAVKGNVMGDTLYIPTQSIQGKTIFGTGYIYSDLINGQYGTISMRYEIYDSATNLTNDFGYIAADSSGPSVWTK